MPALGRAIQKVTGMARGKGRIFGRSWLAPGGLEPYETGIRTVLAIQFLLSKPVAMGRFLRGIKDCNRAMLPLSQPSPTLVLANSRNREAKRLHLAVEGIAPHSHRSALRMVEPDAAHQGFDLLLA